MGFQECIALTILVSFNMTNPSQSLCFNDVYYVLVFYCFIQSLGRLIVQITLSLKTHDFDVLFVYHNFHCCGSSVLAFCIHSFIQYSV
jgi:hypothetical protein